MGECQIVVGVIADHSPNGVHAAHGALSVRGVCIPFALCHHTFSGVIIGDLDNPRNRARATRRRAPEGAPAATCPLACPVTGPAGLAALIAPTRPLAPYLSRRDHEHVDPPPETHHAAQQDVSFAGHGEAKAGGLRIAPIVLYRPETELKRLIKTNSHTVLPGLAPRLALLAPSRWVRAECCELSRARLALFPGRIDGKWGRSACNVTKRTVCGHAGRLHGCGGAGGAISLPPKRSTAVRALRRLAPRPEALYRGRTRLALTPHPSPPGTAHG